MEQKEAVMVLFDREEEYARLLSEFLRRQKELPWEIHTYTKIEELLEQGEKRGGDHAGSGGIFLHGYVEYIGAGMPGDP